METRLSLQDAYTAFLTCLSALFGSGNLSTFYANKIVKLQYS